LGGLALILEIELFTQEHYKQRIEPEENLSDEERDRAVDELIAIV